MRKPIVAAVLIAALGVSAVPALGDTPKPAPSKTKRTSLSALLAEESKTLDELIAEYKAAVKARTKALRLINDAFNKAVAQARAAYTTALAVPGVTAEDKSRAAAELKADIAQATAVRAAAKKALGPAPVDPLDLIDQDEDTL